jgi:hypothetical protein
MTRRLIPQAVIFAVLVLAACGGPAETSAPTGSGGEAASTASASSTAAARTAKISELRNDVDARDQKEAQWADAAEGQQLSAGGGTKTGADSRVRIDTSEGSIIRIGASTEFELLEFSAQEADPVTRIQLDAGKLWVQVTKALGAGTFEVETPAGVATVRGSLMSVEFDRAIGRLAVTCLEGECELRDRAQTAVRLRAGEASEIASLGAGPLAARNMSRAELRDWLENFPEAGEIARSLLGRLVEDDIPTPPAGGSGQTACDHAYFPIRPGATWTYSTSEGPLTWTVDSVSGDATQATAVMVWTIAEVTGTYTWQCDANGMTSFDFGSLTVEGMDFGEVSVTDSSGVWLPAAELLAPGYAWSFSYNATVQIRMEGAPEGVSGQNSQTEASTVLSANPVTSAAGTFEGLQISRSGQLTTQVTMPGIAVPATTIDIGSTWELARGVGMVRWLDTDGSTTELVSYSIP